MSGVGGFPNVPAVVADLDLDLVADAFARNGGNVSDAAADLGVLASDLRRLLWARPKLQDQALRGVSEARIDKAEKNIAADLDSGDPRLRFAASAFTLRHSARAKRRGWITAAAASVDVSISSGPARETVYHWRSGDAAADEAKVAQLVEEGKQVVSIGWGDAEPLERDGRIIPVPRYDNGRRDDDCVEGELTPPATMIEHAPEPQPVVVESEPDPAPEPVVLEAPAPAVEPAADRYRREQVAWWIRARLPSCPMDRCAHCRGPFVVGQAWREAANDEVRVRFHADCHEVWFRERAALARAALPLVG